MSKAVDEINQYLEGQGYRDSVEDFGVDAGLETGGDDV